MHQDDDCAHWLSVYGFVCVCGLCACTSETYSLKNSAAKAFCRHVSIWIFVLKAHILSVEPVNLLTCLIIIYPKQGV